MENLNTEHFSLFIENTRSINSDVLKNIKSAVQIHERLFHYKKILIVTIQDKGKCKSLLPPYKTCDIGDEKIFQNFKTFIKNNNDKNNCLTSLCNHFKVQALFPIYIQKKCVALLGINSEIPTFTDHEIDTALFFASYIEGMLHTDNLVKNLKNYSDRMQKILQEMGTLHEITHALESTDSIDSLLEYIMKKSMKVMQAEAASLMLVIEETNELEFKVALGPKGTEVKSFRLPIGKGISGWVAEKGKAVLITDAYADPRFDPSFDKRSGFKTHSMLCVPMIHQSKTVGVMTVLNRLDGKPFSENDQRLFTIFASQAALSIENARLLIAAIEKERLDKELQLASEIQNLLLPQSIPDVPFLDIAADYIPCKEVSGDFYDIMKLDENRYIFVVADVSGKGIPGAMVVSNMQATLKAYLEYSSDLLSVISKLNEAIIRQTTTDRYITFFMGLYNSKDATFHYINAGHNPPVLLRKNGTIKELNKGGVFIGYVPWEYESETITLKSGDILVLYTDGLVEAMNEKEEEFRIENLEALLKKNSHLDSKEIEAKIIDAVIKHTGNISLEDDFTLVTLKYIK